MKIRVYYEDTDAGGIVYHSKYLNFCERARSECFFKNNLSPLGKERDGFVVKSIEANFLKVAYLGDLLEVKTKVLEQKRASLVLEQKILREEKEIFKMKILLAYIKDFRPTRIPDSVLEILKSCKWITLTFC